MIEIIHSMKEIDRTVWNNLTGRDKVETSHEWLSFAEDVNFDRKLTYCHAIHRENGDITGILPAYYINTYLWDFAVSFGLLNLTNSLPKIKTLFKMTQIQLPLSIDSRYFGDKKHFKKCLTTLEDFSKEHHHSFLFIKNSSEKMDLPGYLCIGLFPEVYTEPYPSWDAYIQSQDGKQGKHMRYEYKKSIEHGTKTSICEDLDGYYNVLYRMNLNITAKYKNVLVYPEYYFKKMREHLPEYTKCILAENEGDITGYLLLLENDYFITCKHAGRNYQAPDPYVYFRLIYELIKYSIEKKKPISIEKGSYKAKLRRGFKLIEKWCYIKPNYPLVGDMYLALVRKSNNKVLSRIEEIKALQK